MRLSFLVAIATLIGSGFTSRSQAQAKPGAPCCTVTAIDAQTGTASAKVDATGAQFAFKIADPKDVQALKVGAGVYANFTTHQVSLNGRDVCCVMATTVAAESHAALPASPSAIPVRLANNTTTKLAVVTVSAGSPEGQRLSSPSTGPRPRAEARTVSAKVNGSSVTAHLLHLRGLDGIEQAQGLPDGVREILMMHVKTLGADQFDHYLVNLDLANEWAKTHPVPASVKKEANDGDSHTGCKSFSMHCAGEVGKHAEGQAQNLIDDAKKDWSHATAELGHDWDVAADQVEACFADHATNTVDLPIDFTVSLPSLVTYGKVIKPTSTTPSSSGTTTGAPQVTVTVAGQQVPGLTGTPAAPASAPLTNGLSGGLIFGLPTLSTKGTVTHMDFFYIPCLPFVLRPRSVGATGSMSVETSIVANLEVAGQYSHQYAVPPIDIKYPLYTYPIMAGPVPVAVVDYALFIQGFLKISADGKVTEALSLDNSHNTNFDYTCDGKGCTWRSSSEPQITKKSSDIDQVAAIGRIEIDPKVFTGISVDVDYDAISVRTGPEPGMEGDVLGAACASVGAKTQAADALMSELDWTPAIRMDLLVAEQLQGDGYDHTLTRRLVSFNDLAPGGSTALIPGLSGPKNAKPGNAEAYSVKMPDCYPFSEPVAIQLTWTGTVTPMTNTPTTDPGSSTCDFKAGQTQATCWMDPKKGMSVSFAWPQSGQYTITAVAVKDKFGRDLGKTAKAATLPIQVGS